MLLYYILHNYYNYLKMSTSKTTSKATFKEFNICSCGKRKYNDAFHADTFDDARFGQHIDDEFFKTNVSDSKLLVGEDEILKWCQYYLANRNLYRM